MSKLENEQPKVAEETAPRWTEEERLAYIKSKRGFDHTKVRIGVTVFHFRHGVGKLVNINVRKKCFVVAFASGKFFFSLDSFERGILNLKCVETSLFSPQYPFSE